VLPRTVAGRITSVTTTQSDSAIAGGAGTSSQRVAWGLGCSTGVEPIPWCAQPAPPSAAIAMTMKRGARHDRHTLRKHIDTLIPRPIIRETPRRLAPH
jgi:hypothetical protein